ncbi:hypothetical protein KI387_000887, partial [Taxus chinensis]
VGSCKYKGRLPFNCGKVGHFENKFSHNNMDEDVEIEGEHAKNDNISNKYQKKFKRFNNKKNTKNSLYSKKE